MKFIDIQLKLKKSMTLNGVVHKRYNHSLAVVEMALSLNKLHHLGLDEDKVFLAALLHDAAKLKSNEELLMILNENLEKDRVKTIHPFPAIWHSFAGKFVVKKEYGITDEEILNAIYYHTTGKPKMTDLEKLIFISDYIEKTRTGIHFDIARMACYKDLNEGLKIILTQIVDYLKKSGTIIYDLTEKTYDYYVYGDYING